MWQSVIDGCHEFAFRPKHFGTTIVCVELLQLTFLGTCSIWLNCCQKFAQGMILSKAGHGAEVQFNYKDLECHFNQPLLDKKVPRAVEWQPVLLQGTSAVWTFPLVPVGIFPSFHGISGMQENTGFSFCSS